MMSSRLRAGLLIASAILLVASIWLPLWGMTLVSVQYPEGLRMVIYPTRITGDVAEINVLNHYIGMAEISEDFFLELRVLPVLFALTAVTTLVAAFVRRWWAAVVPLALMGGTAVYGIWSMRSRLYEYGHDLDPTAPMDVEPFTPAMFGEHVIAQFGTYAYFSWGALLPMVAGALVIYTLWHDWRQRRTLEARP